MRTTRASIGRAVDQPGPDTRLYLFYGQDAAQSRALAKRLLEALGATKYVLASSSISVLPKSSALIKLVEASPQAVGFQAWIPDSEEAERIVIDLGRRFGLKISPSVAERVAGSSGNDQAIAAQELQKLALYVGASPEAPKELEHGAIDDVGAGHAEGDFLRLADLALGGDIAELADELAHLPTGGSEAIPVIRSLQRRLLMLAPARARMERGERLGAVMTSLGRALFSKEKNKVERMLSKWTAADLATVAERTSKLERSLMLTKSPDREALGEELFAIARKARSL